MNASALVFALAVSAAPQAGQPLTLDDAVRIALERQPTLVQAHATTQAAQARADETRASLLPQVSLNAGYPFLLASSGGRSASGTQTPASFGFSPNFAANLQASQLLWDFGGTFNRWQASLSTAEAQQAQEHATRLQTILNVQTAYFLARAQNELVGVARDTLQNQLRHQQQVESFVQVGTRAPIDLAQARTDTANAKVQLINSENNFRISLAQLNHAMGFEGSLDYTLADTNFPALAQENAPVEKLMEQALAARPEFVAIERQVRAQELSLTALGGDYFPRLSVSTAFTNVGLQDAQFTWNWNAQLSLSWQIFQGGLTTAQQREARANLLSLQAQRDALRQQVRLEVEQARVGVEGANAALQASEEALVNARERLRLAEGRYEAGAGNIIELGDAQVAATSAAAQLAQARFNLASARARLSEALGGPTS